MRHNVEVGRDALSRDAPWEAVVKEMGGKRTTMQCRKKWYVCSGIGLVGGVLVGL